jgi:hypothetical protein
MEALLGRLRHTMESGQLTVTRPVLVHLPSQLFASTAPTNRPVNIIDLPGDSPANAAEQAHVSQVASQYIPNADLVLLLGKADDLGFLDPEKLVLPVLGDWRYSPGRFRLITTFTIQSASFREWLRHQSQVDAMAIRRRLLTQLETFEDIELPSDAREPALYFPLEFGESWEALKVTDPEIYANVQPVMSDLLDDLKRDIQRSASPHMRLWRATQVHIVANRVKRGHERQVRADIQEKMESASSLEGRAQFLRQSAESLTAAAQALPNKEQTGLFLVNLPQKLGRIPGRLPASAPYENPRVSAFFYALDENVKALVRMGHSFEPPVFDGFDPTIYAPAPATVRSWIEAYLGDFRRRLNDYKLDRYQPQLFDSFDIDIADFNRLCKDCVEGLRTFLQRHWQGAMVGLVSKWESQRQSLLQQAEVARTDAANLSSKAKEIQGVAAHKELQLQVFVARLEKDEAKGAQFVDMLKDSYTKQARQIAENYRQQSSPAAKVLVLLSLRQLQEEKMHLFSFGQADKESNE